MQTKKLLSVAAALVAVACSDGTSPGSTVSLSLSTSGAQSPVPASAFAVAAAADTLMGASNTLVIESVEMVLREIELERVGVPSCDVDPEPAGCEKFETGPVLFELPLNGATQQVLTIEPASGTYDRVEFDIHKVSGDPEDAEFRAAHPDLVETSIRVRGSYNGMAFTFTTDLMEKQEYALVPAVEVGDGAPTNVTLYLDVANWFSDGAGDYVDPASANKGGTNENPVKDNIRDSIDAFEDSDRDGRPE